MSVILEALKKLDREKSSRRNGPANIAVEILRPDLPGRGRRLPLYTAIVIFTAVAAAAITYAVVEFNLLSKSSPPAPMKPAGISQQAAPPPPISAESSPPAPVHSPAISQRAAPDPMNSAKPSPTAPVHSPPSSQQAAPAPVSREPTHDLRDEINQVPPKIETRSEGKTASPAPDVIEAPRTGTSEKPTVAPGHVEKPAELTPVTPAASPPSLKLSAIVWHEEPSKRIAMINGTISTEGSVIEGAKVEEIYPNRVRLSHNGRPFEISLK